MRQILLALAMIFSVSSFAAAQKSPLKHLNDLSKEARERKRILEESKAMEKAREKLKPGESRQFDVVHDSNGDFEKLAPAGKPRLEKQGLKVNRTVTVSKPAVDLHAERTKQHDAKLRARAEADRARVEAEARARAKPQAKAPTRAPGEAGGGDTGGGDTGGGDTGGGDTGGGDTGGSKSYEPGDRFDR